MPFHNCLAPGQTPSFFAAGRRGGGESRFYTLEPLRRPDSVRSFQTLWDDLHVTGLAVWDMPGRSLQRYVSDMPETGKSKAWDMTRQITLGRTCRFQHASCLPACVHAGKMTCKLPACKCVQVILSCMDFHAGCVLDAGMKS